ncbi:MAG: hypothetical protein ACRC8A_08875, partial [Microcoleaceae cyanobacterium]
MTMFYPVSPPEPPPIFLVVPLVVPLQDFLQFSTRYDPSLPVIESNELNELEEQSGDQADQIVTRFDTTVSYSLLLPTTATLEASPASAATLLGSPLSVEANGKSPLPEPLFSLSTESLLFSPQALGSSVLYPTLSFIPTELAIAPTDPVES